MHTEVVGQWTWIDPGAFALVGAGAFMGGVTRLTIALAVIMIEVGGALLCCVWYVGYAVRTMWAVMAMAVISLRAWCRSNRFACLACTVGSHGFVRLFVCLGLGCWLLMCCQPGPRSATVGAGWHHDRPAALFDGIIRCVLFKSCIFLMVSQW